jgi:acylglycerol lipase
MPALMSPRLRRLAASTLVLGGLLLSGCAGVPLPGGSNETLALDAPAVPRAATEPLLTEAAVVEDDGVALPLRRSLPKGEPKAVILALHGFNDYSNAFAIPAPSFAAAGIATYAYDQRGFGEAPGTGRWAGQTRMAADAVVAARLLRQRYPGVPLYLMGESMGGAVAILAAAGTAEVKPADIDGVILVAPAVWGRQTMNIFERAGLFLSRLMPSMQLSGRSLPIKVMASDNIPMLRAYGADPLVLKETRADTLNGLVDLMSAALAAAPRLARPALILYGQHDEIVPRAPVAQMVANLPKAARPQQRVAFYPNGWHMLMRDLHGADVSGDVVSWVIDVQGPLPSGADRGARFALTGQRDEVLTAGVAAR